MSIHVNRRHGVPFLNPCNYVQLHKHPRTLLVSLMSWNIAFIVYIHFAVRTNEYVCHLAICVPTNFIFEKDFVLAIRKTIRYFYYAAYLYLFICNIYFK